MTDTEMITITCKRSPNLLIPHLGIQFVDGTAQVPADQLDALAAYRIHGVILPGDEPDPDPLEPTDEQLAVSDDESDGDAEEPAAEAKPKRASKPFC